MFNRTFANVIRDTAERVVLPLAPLVCGVLLVRGSATVRTAPIVTRRVENVSVLQVSWERGAPKRVPRTNGAQTASRNVFARTVERVIRMANVIVPMDLPVNSACESAMRENLVLTASLSVTATTERHVTQSTVAVSVHQDSWVRLATITASRAHMEWAVRRNATV